MKLFWWIKTSHWLAKSIWSISGVKMYSKFNLNIFTSGTLSCGKVMFLHLCVILFTEGCMHGKGGMRDMGMHGKEGTCHSKGVGACVVGEAGIAGVCMQGACMAGGCVWWGSVRAGETAIEARGTHPTGMHSCYTFWQFNSNILKRLTLKVHRYCNGNGNVCKVRMVTAMFWYGKFTVARNASVYTSAAKTPGCQMT